MNIVERRDLIAGAGFVVIALLIIFLAIPYGVQEPKKVKFVALSPSYYPRLVSYCLLGFGLLYFLKQLFNRKVDSEVDKSSTIKPIMLLVITATLLFYYLTLPWLGFVLSSTIVLFVLLLIAGDRNPIALIIIPLLLPIGVYWFFTKVANIPIPAGVLEPLLVGS